MEQRVIITQNFQNDLAMALVECERDRIFVLTDENTHAKCWPLLSNFYGLKQAQIITIPAGDDNKSIEQLAYVWQTSVAEWSLTWADLQHQHSSEASTSSTYPPRCSQWSTQAWAERRA